jgi:hypothetical protein
VATLSKGKVPRIQRESIQLEIIRADQSIEIPGNKVQVMGMWTAKFMREKSGRIVINLESQSAMMERARPHVAMVHIFPIHWHKSHRNMCADPMLLYANFVQYTDIPTRQSPQRNPRL